MCDDQSFDLTSEVDFDIPILDPLSLPNIPGVEATGPTVRLLNSPPTVICVPASGTTFALGPNLNLRWGYGFGNRLLESRFMIDKLPGKGTAPIKISYLGETCAISEPPQVVNLDAGKSSLRYSSLEWQLNWQTGQSTLNDSPLVPGCYLVEIPGAAGNGAADTKQIILTE